MINTIKTNIYILNSLLSIHNRIATSKLTICPQSFHTSLTNKSLHLTSSIKFKGNENISNNIKSTINRNSAISQQNNQPMTKQQVLKTYLQIIPPYKLQAILQPQKTDLTQFIHRNQQIQLTKQQLQKLYKKIKKSVHIIPIQNLTQVLQIIQIKNKQNNSQQIQLSKKIYTKIISQVRKKLNILNLQQIVNFMYKLVKLNHKQYEFMKQKIKINYPLIRKILFSFTHLDIGSSILYSHIAKTLKIGQHQFTSLQLAQSAYMLSKISQNAAGGYGIFLIAQKHLLSHFPRLNFHQLVKVASYMLSQNLGTNQFQQQLQKQLYNKYPNRNQLRLNDLVSLLKSTSSYYFKYKDKSLLNTLQSSTNKLCKQSNLQQFQDIIWSWGRAGKGDKQLWKILQQQIQNKYINILKPRQLAFFYYSLCSTEYSSRETIKLLQNKFIEVVNKNKDNINQHYLLKFLLGMQKSKNYNQQKFIYISKIICERFDKLSIKQLITFTKIINQSDLCYENKQIFKDMQKQLNKIYQKAIAQKIYIFRINQIIEILYMWIKLDINQYQQKDEKSNNTNNTNNNKFINILFEQISNNINQIPKSSFIKSLFSFTIKDKYKQSLQMIQIMQQLLKYGNITYFFSPYQLPLASYCIFHLIVNSNYTIQINQQLIQQLSSAMKQINPIMLNKFVRNGYDQCIKLIQKYKDNKPQRNQRQKESQSQKIGKRNNRSKNKKKL